MAGGTGPTKGFGRAVALFFVLVSLALIGATYVNAPLSFDGALYLFQALNSHHFATPHSRLINIPLQVPVMAAASYTEDLSILRALFSTTYAMVPLLGLIVSWRVCKSRPSLFMWAALAICVGALPGQFSFQSEAIMTPTLLWPALLAVLIDPPAKVLPWVALMSVAAMYAHPYAGVILAFIDAIAIASAIIRRGSRRRALGYALVLSVLLLSRILMRFDPYETAAVGFRTVVVSFNDAVMGWPLIAIASIAIAASMTLCIPERHRRTIYLTAPIAVAGIALTIWALHPTDWARCDDYRYWDAPVSMSLMGCAALEALWLRPGGRNDNRLAELKAVPLIGAIFLIVLSIQGLEWRLGSRNIAEQLAISDRGCISFKSVASIRDTALDFWSLSFYAVELQSRTPRTLILPHNFTCRLFSISGDATMVQRGDFIYIQKHGEGWFDFTDARSRARSHGRSRLPGV